MSHGLMLRSEVKTLYESWTDAEIRGKDTFFLDKIHNTKCEITCYTFLNNQTVIIEITSLCPLHSRDVDIQVSFAYVPTYTPLGVCTTGLE